MINSNLIELLKTFTPQEMKEFCEFASSEFFNKNENVIKLCNYVRKCYPDLDSQKLEKEYVYHKLYSKGKYSDGFMRTVMFKLQKLVEEYLSYINSTKDKRRHMLHLLFELTERGNMKLLGKKFGELEKILSGSGYDDPEAYYFKFNYEFLKDYYYSVNFALKKGKEPEERIYNEQEFLICYFVLRILAYHFYHLNQRLVINITPKLLFIDEIVNFLNNHEEFLENPVINISFLKVLLLKELKDEYYYRLKEVFIREVDNLSLADNFNTVSIIINYCQHAYLNTGDKKYLKEKFEISKFAIENKIYSFGNDEYFSETKFKLIVQAGAAVREFKWLEKFISEYKALLNPEIRKDVVNISQACIAFEKKEYDAALKLLNIIQVLTDMSSKITLKTLYLMIFYELNWFEQALSLSDSFRHIITKDTLTPDFQKESTWNFLKIYKKLLSLKVNFDKDKYDSFNLELTKARKVVNKDWLLEKANEMKQMK